MSNNTKRPLVDVEGSEWAELYDAYEFNSDGWIRRHHERIEFLDVSVYSARRVAHLEIKGPSAAVEAEGRLWIPVGFIAKGGTAPRELIVKDGQNSRLPLLPAPFDREPTYNSLLRYFSAARIVLDRNELDALAIVTGRSPSFENQREARDVLLSVCKRSHSPSEGIRLLDRVVHAGARSLLVAGIDASDRKRSSIAMFVSLSYITPFEIRQTGRLGRVRRALSFDTTDVPIETPDIGRCDSYHLEVAAPRDLEITKAAIVFMDDRGEANIAEASEPGALAHLHTREARLDNDHARALVCLRTVLRKWHFIGVSVTWVSAIGLLLAAMLPDHVMGERDALVALLITAPSVAVTGLMSEAVNPLTAKIVRPLRIMAIVTSVVAFVGAWLFVSWPAGNDPLTGSSADLSHLRAALYSLAGIAFMFACFQMVPLTFTWNRHLRRYVQRLARLSNSSTDVVRDR